VTPPVALTIAGSDSGGGAGLQADLKTFAVHGVFGTSVVTALTAQNTAEVRAIAPVPPSFVAAQLEAVLDDLSVAAVKTGMLAGQETVALLAGYARRLPNLVVDPVLVASSGQPLFAGAAVEAYRELLFPHAAVVTPNLYEAGLLVGRTLSTLDDAVAAAEELATTGAGCVVVKGGHLDSDDGGQAIDVVWSAGRYSLLRAPRISSANNHGTGCTFAAATAARLALGDSLPEALSAAKFFVHRALRRAVNWRLGSGHGPLSWEVRS
jgi:hydroxymethylpyrimidine/phosphomethylpyrimidine kinase